VVPRMMGVFNNCPTLVGCVCDHCNSNVFNRLESIFKEDTEEGIFCQMLNLEGHHQIRIRGVNVKSTFASGIGEDFFNEIFPFLRFEDGDMKIVFRPQIKIKKNGESGYIVLLLEDLLELKKIGGKKITKIQKILCGIPSKDICIFAGSNGPDDQTQLGEAIELVRFLGIEYKDKAEERRFASIDDGGKRKRAGVSLSCTVNSDVGRVIAKIAFNYFAYCAIKSGNESVLYDDGFAKIKAYILGQIDLPIKEVIPLLERETHLIDEKIEDVRFVAHTIVFSEENGMLISRVSFFGRVVYTVILGAMPNELKALNFGSGHLFDPKSGDIFGLTQNPLKWRSGILNGFSLFSRI